MSKKIAVLCEMIYQYDLQLFLSGGGERWVVDFITLLKEMNYDVEIFQFSYEKKTVRYKNHKIHGLGNISKSGGDYNQQLLNGLKEFQQINKDADGFFYLTMNLNQISTDKKTLCVSHGIWWDGDLFQYDPKQMMNNMKSWIKNCTHCISVDTNTIHASQIYFPQYQDKFTYIPNYVDLNQFQPVEKKDKSKFTVIFPRRIHLARGYVQTAEASKILTEKYDDIEIIFCGKGYPQDEANLKQMIKGLRNVKHISMEMTGMHKAYELADVALIPTILAEGTSLSCLEALASGTVPIVTWTGGLTDLVQKNVNGLIIKPNDVKELVDAIEYCYHNKNEVQRMKENGLRMINSFGKDRWKLDVSKVVKGIYGEC